MRSKFRARTLVNLGWLMGSALAPVGAQTAPPHITSVTQSGGQRGTQIELKISGVHIGQGTGLWLEGNGLTVESFAPDKPPAGQPPKPEGSATAHIRIAPDAEPGWRALRVATPLGVSDLGHMTIGQWPETADKEPNNTRAQSQEIHLPVTVMGKLDAAEDMDCFRFHADAGQILVFDVFATRMESPIVPVLSVQDENGKEVALTEDFRRQDTPLFFRVPKAGTYFVLLHDLNYQGGPDFAYRLTVGAIPWVSGVLPSGGAPGARLNVQITGVNLGDSPSCSITMPAEISRRPTPLALALATGLSNPILLMPGNLPEKMESEPNDTPANAQLLPVPCTVNGRVYRTGSGDGSDVDCYRFHASQGQSLILEVVAQRIGSPLDSVLKVLDASGKELASNDDAVGTDSRLEFKAPQAGDYIARITDLNGRQGPDFVYRFTIRAPEPDFRLEFAPDRLSVGQGDAIPLTVTATREQGFDGEIALNFDGMPAGTRIVGAPRIPAGQKEAILEIAAAPDAPVQAKAFALTGTAAIGGKPVQHSAQSLLEEYVRNDDRIERRTRPSTLPMLAVATPSDMTVTATPDHLTLAPGKTVEIKVKIVRKAGFNAKVPLAILGLPAGITPTLPEIAEKQTDATITLKREGNPPPGDISLVVVAKSVLDDLRFVPHCAPLLTLTLTK